MNKRPFCSRCQRPQSACLCHVIETIDNRVELVILQHPSEQKHAKGTARLLQLSLQRCELWIGEDFSEHAGLQALLADPGRRVFLLYPGEQAVSATAVARDIEADGWMATVILLDGTWKKAYKLLCLNPVLATLPKIAIAPPAGSNYRIRKAPRQDSLSSVEAGAAVLGELEGDHPKFAPLLRAFDYLVDYQLSRMPPSARQHYR